MMKIRIEVDSACPKEEIVFRCSSLSEENVCLYEKLKELASALVPVKWTH